MIYKALLLFIRQKRMRRSSIQKELNEMQNIFITAASGNIGNLLIPSLLTNVDIRLILPTSSAQKLAKYDNQPNVTILEGPLSDPHWLESQFLTHHVDTVFINLWGLDELFTAFNMLDCIIRVPSIKHVVYLSACGDFLNDPDHVIDWFCPHTKIKPPMEKALQRMMDVTLKERRFSYTTIGPSLFFENDEKVKEPLLFAKRWVEPLGEVGASRVSVADVAGAVEIALLDRGVRWAGRKINVGTLKKYTVSFRSFAKCLFKRVF